MSSDKCILSYAFTSDSRQKLFASAPVPPQVITSPPQSQVPTRSVPKTM